MKYHPCTACIRPGFSKMKYHTDKGTNSMNQTCYLTWLNSKCMLSSPVWEGYNNYRFILNPVCILQIFQRVCWTCMFSLFLGITDDGFEMLEQLAYLYLANNKVSHGRTRIIFLLWCNVTLPAPDVFAPKQKSKWEMERIWFFSAS